MIDRTYHCWVLDEMTEDDAREISSHDAESAAAKYAEWYYERNAGDMGEYFDVVVKRDREVFSFPISVGYRRYYVVGAPISFDS